MVAKAKQLHGSKSARTKSDKRYSKANYEFDVYDDLWQLDANKSLNFELLAPLNLDPKFEINFKLVFTATAALQCCGTRVVIEEKACQSLAETSSKPGPNIAET